MQTKINVRLVPVVTIDERTVSAATDRWVNAGLIDERTAVAIQEYESNQTDGRPIRLTTIIAGMGAALVGVGIFVYLAANWRD